MILFTSLLVFRTIDSERIEMLVGFAREQNFSEDVFSGEERC